MKKTLPACFTCLLFYQIVFCTDLTAMERFDIVTTQQLSQMLKEKQSGKYDFILVNTLDRLIYLNQSIPGSINIPWSMAEFTAQKHLGNNYEKPIVTYCMGYR